MDLHIYVEWIYIYMWNGFTYICGMDLHIYVEWIYMYMCNGFIYIYMCAPREEDIYICVCVCARMRALTRVCVCVFLSFTCCDLLVNP